LVGGHEDQFSKEACAEQRIGALQACTRRHLINSLEDTTFRNAEDVPKH
jgi:hypothetical protein